jgi:hypothetical protein
MLGLGAIIPDGPIDQMQHRFFELFPGIARALQNENKEAFVTTDFHVAIDASSSHKTWFGTGPEVGLDVISRYQTHMPRSVANQTRGRPGKSR